MMSISSRMCTGPGNVNSEQLRSQLNQLRKEASETAAKANNARLRLLRLSEAAEKLRKQAAKSIRVGDDDDARDLLLQKKKILQAMDKSKTRAHLLDQLATKLTQAISVKETNLIGKVTSDLEFGKEDVSSAVHVVSPVQDTEEILDATDKFRQSDVAVCVDSDSQLDCETEGITTGADEKSRNSTSSDNIRHWIESEVPSSLEGISSYNHFLEHLDSQLQKIETDLTAYLRLLNMVLEDKERATNVKLQQATEIRDKILDARRSVQHFFAKRIKSRPSYLWLIFHILPRIYEPGRHKGKSELTEERIKKADIHHIIL